MRILNRIYQTYQQVLKQPQSVPRRIHKKKGFIPPRPKFIPHITSNNVVKTLSWARLFIYTLAAAAISLSFVALYILRNKLYNYHLTIMQHFTKQRMIKEEEDEMHYYNRSELNLKDRILTQTKMFISDTLSLVKNESLVYLERMFKAEDTHEASLELLKGVIKDDRFIEETKILGLDLILSVLNTEQCNKDVQSVLEEVLKGEEIRKEAVSIVRYIGQQEEAKAFMGDFFKDIFVRPDMDEGLGQLVARSTHSFLLSPESKMRARYFLTQVVSNKDFQRSIAPVIMDPIKTYLYNTVTFGFFKREDDMNELDGANRQNEVMDSVNEIIRLELRDHQKFKEVFEKK